MHHHPIPNWGLAAWPALKTGVLCNLWGRLHLPWDAGMSHPALLSSADISPARVVLCGCTHWCLSGCRKSHQTHVMSVLLSCLCQWETARKAHFSLSVFTVLEYDSKEVLTQKTSLVPTAFQPLLFDSWSISFSSHVNSIVFIKQRLVPDLASVLLWLLSDVVDIDPFLAHQATDEPSAYNTHSSVPRSSYIQMNRFCNYYEMTNVSILIFIHNNQMPL